MLLRIQALLQSHSPMSLPQLAKALGSSPDAVREMLAHWITKGKVMRCTDPKACQKTCGGCQTVDVEYYQWLD